MALSISSCLSRLASSLSLFIHTVHLPIYQYFLAPFPFPPPPPPFHPSRQAESASEKSAGGAIAAFAFFLSIIFGIFSVFLFMWRQYLPVRQGERGGREGRSESKRRDIPSPFSK